VESWALPFGIAVERSGMILVANAQALLRLDPETGAQTVVSSHGLFPGAHRRECRGQRDIFVVRDWAGDSRRTDQRGADLISSRRSSQAATRDRVKGQMSM